MLLDLFFCRSDHQMMSRPLSAVGYRRPLCHHAHMAMMMRADMRYKVGCTFLPVRSKPHDVQVYICSRKHDRTDSLFVMKKVSMI